MVTETFADQMRVVMLVVFTVPTALGFGFALVDVIALYIRQRRPDPSGAGRRRLLGTTLPRRGNRWQAARSDAENVRRIIQEACDQVQQQETDMPRGTIKRLVAGKGFGFIRDDQNGQELFFHMSACANFGALREGQAVTYIKADSLKGPRAESVNAAD